MKDKPKYNRAEQRKIAELNTYLDKLITSFLKFRAVRGEGLATAAYADKLNGLWKQYAIKFNKKKWGIEAQVASFDNEVSGIYQIEGYAEEIVKDHAELKRYDMWLKQMETYRPWSLRLVKVLGFFYNLFHKKIDYVKEHYQGLQEEGFTYRFL